MKLIPPIKLDGSSFCRAIAVLSAACLVIVCGCNQRAAPSKNAEPSPKSGQAYFLKYKAKAEKGDALAQTTTGHAYWNGDGVEKDYAEAAVWYRKAADQNNADAQYSLAMLYNYGEGVKQNDAEAAKWFRKAAEQNSGPAQIFLGIAYEFGTGVEVDYTEALKWYRKAAEYDWPSQINVAEFYKNGQGVAKDDTEAYAWFNLAAKTDKGAASERDNLAKTMSPQQVATAQKRTAELRAEIAARRKSGGK